jgi:hypothetical protein
MSPQRWGGGKRVWQAEISNMSVIEFAPTGIFQMRRYRIAQDGAAVGEIDCRKMRQGATIVIGGATYTTGRDGVMSGAFYLEGNGSRLASAVPASAFKGGFIVQTGGRTLTLARASAFGRTFALTENGAAIGTIAPQGFFSRKSKADLPDDLPMELKAFLIWLIIVIWQRQVMVAGVIGATAGGR